MLYLDWEGKGGEELVMRGMEGNGMEGSLFSLGLGRGRGRGEEFFLPSLWFDNN